MRCIRDCYELFLCQRGCSAQLNLDAGFLQDSGNILLCANSHNMYAVAQVFVFDLGNHFCGHLDSQLHRQALDALLLALSSSGSKNRNCLVRDRKTPL